MKSPRTTRLLILLVLLSAAACWMALARMQKLRDDSTVARRNLTLAVRDMEEIAQLQRSGASASLDTPELTAQLRAAALAAGLRDAPDHDSAPPARLGSSDYTQTMVFLHFGPVTLRQLIAFLHHLGESDRGSRVQQIELAIPENAPAGSRDLWDANAAVAYLTYSPARGTKSAE